MSGNLGDRIRQVRKLLRKSQDEFGLDMGVSQSRQSRIEKEETEIPSSYLKNIVDKYGEYFNKNWLYLGEGSINNQVNEPNTDNYLARLKEEDLSPEEEELLGEVEHFSDFLKKKDLKPRLKRLLLERLIDSIDQALDQPQYKE